MNIKIITKKTQSNSKKSRTRKFVKPVKPDKNVKK